MDYLAFFVGALVITWAISRITRRLLFRKSTGWVRAVGPNAVTLAVSAAFGGVGTADGGPPQFLLAFVRYLPPVLFWIAIDAYRGRAREVDQTPVA